MDLSKLDMSKPPPELPQPHLVPLDERLAAVDRALALPRKTPEAVRAAVGPAVVKHCATLVEMLCRPGADLSELRRMLALAVGVRDGRVVKDDATEGLKEKYFGQFVKPIP